MLYNHLAYRFNGEIGIIQYWDTTAAPPYAFNAQRQIMATYDDSESVKLKTEYAIKHGMNRIMFGQLADDLFINGLLHVISAAKKQEGRN